MMWEKLLLFILKFTSNKLNLAIIKSDWTISLLVVLKILPHWERQVTVSTYILPTSSSGSHAAKGQYGNEISLILNTPTCKTQVLVTTELKHCKPSQKKLAGIFLSIFFPCNAFRHCLTRTVDGTLQPGS